MTWSTEAREEAITYMEARRLQPAIWRDEDSHVYTYEGKEYPGVTGIIKVVDKSAPLMTWAARQAVAGVLDQVDALPTMLANNDKATLVQMLAKRSTWDRDKAAKRGTDIHEHAANIVSGLELGTVSPEHRKMVAAVQEWWASSGWKLRLSEAFVVHPTLGYGGSFDLLAYDENGKTVLGDFKTGDTYPEHRLQLAAYGDAELVAPQGSPKAYPMPTVDRHVILLITDTKVKSVELHIDDEDRAAFRACIPLSRWNKAHANDWKRRAA
jgi:hypothetical protein